MSSAVRLHYHHSLDTPLPIRAVEGVVRLKGWCFADGGDAHPFVQLRVGDLRLTAPTGTQRDDVAGAFPSFPQAAHSGFELSGHLPAGLSVAELWAGRDGFGWERLRSFSVYAEAAVLHGAIDLPLEKEITTNRTIDGWCFHPQREIVELWLHYGTGRVRCRQYGHDRADVGRQFPHLPQARLCGFSSEAVLNPGEGRIRLCAVDRAGGRYFCETDHHVRLLPPPSVHASDDVRLDGRALFQAFSSRQASLPRLRVLLAADPAGDTAHLEKVSAALEALPGENWLIFLNVGTTPPSESLRSLAAAHPRVVLGPAPAPDPLAWDFRLAPDEIPDIHGLMAALLAVAEQPGLAAVYGDFTSGEKRELHRLPRWSADLALAGGLDGTAPVLLVGGGWPASPAVLPPLVALAAARAKVVHLPAILSHRPGGPAKSLASWLPGLAAMRPGLRPALASGPDRIAYTAGERFQLPSITAMVLGDSAALPALKQAFLGEVDDWLAVGPAPSPAELTAAARHASGELVLFLSPGTRPASVRPIEQLAVQLAGAPGSAVVPLLLDERFAPWSEADFLSARTRAVLQDFDPGFPAWTDRALALFTRQTAYFALPGLLIGRDRLHGLGGLDKLYESPAGALLDLAFRLRAAGTPPVVCAEARLVARPGPGEISAFEETLLLDRWDRDEHNPRRVRPLVATEVMA